MAQKNRTYVYIHLGGQFVPAGRLTMVEEGRGGYARFQYGARYLNRPDRLEIDPITLRFPADRSTEYQTAEGFVLFGAIRDAAPDGWGRHVLDRAAGGMPLSEFDYLTAAGMERIGALAFGPDLSGPRRVTPWSEDRDLDGEVLDLAAMLQAADQLASAEELESRFRTFIIRGSSLGGARPKATLDWKGRPYIAKFGRQDDRMNICRLEYATMRLARACGLNVPSVELVTVLDRDIYLIERFDREVRSAAVIDREARSAAVIDREARSAAVIDREARSAAVIDREARSAAVINREARDAAVINRDLHTHRRHFISALTLLGVHESESQRYAYSDIADALRQHGTEFAADAHELFRRMIFNILCNNTDDHLRNHGFLHDGRGWRLSPAYDIVPYPQAGLTHLLALGVGDRGREASVHNALTRSASFGLRGDEAQRMVDEMQGLCRSWEAHYRDCGVGEDDLRRLASCFAWADAPPDAALLR